MSSEKVCVKVTKNPQNNIGVTCTLRRALVDMEGFSTKLSLANLEVLYRKGHVFLCVLKLFFIIPQITMFVEFFGTAGWVVLVSISSISFSGKIVQGKAALW